MLMLASFVIAFAFLAFFMFAVAFMLMVAALMVAFAFMAFFMLATFVFVAFMFWHVGLHFLHLLCHVDGFCSLFFVEVFPVGEGVDHCIHATHHFRAHLRFLAMMVALMMFLALLFFIFAALFLFAILFVFLFVAA